jgi:hypothetical protein
LTSQPEGASEADAERDAILNGESCAILTLAVNKLAQIAVEVRWTDAVVSRASVCTVATFQSSILFLCEKNFVKTSIFAISLPFKQ